MNKEINEKEPAKTEDISNIELRRKSRESLKKEAEKYYRWRKQENINE